jgi:hypothetical protein
VSAAADTAGAYHGEQPFFSITELWSEAERGEVQDVTNLGSAQTFSATPGSRAAGELPRQHDLTFNRALIRRGPRRCCGTVSCGLEHGFAVSTKA